MVSQDFLEVSMAWALIWMRRSSMATVMETVLVVKAQLER
jgi:hypothetical protein